MFRNHPVQALFTSCLYKDVRTPYKTSLFKGGGHKRDTHATVYLYQKEDTPSHQIQKAIGLRDALLGFWKFLEEYVHG